MVEKAKEFARILMEKDGSGHDYFHTERVYRTALTIAREEAWKKQPDMEAVALIALLHDVDDRKLSPETCENLGHARDFLTQNGVSQDRIEFVLSGIRQISFKGTDSKAPDSLEAQCVQDADRLDAMGAMGIARTFAYGGKHGRSLSDSIRHFEEKLLLLKNEMNTTKGKQIAEARHAFLEQFLAEWKREVE